MPCTPLWHGPRSPIESAHIVDRYADDSVGWHWLAMAGGVGTGQTAARPHLRGLRGNFLHSPTVSATISRNKQLGWEILALTNSQYKKFPPKPFVSVHSDAYAARNPQRSPQPSRAARPQRAERSTTGRQRSTGNDNSPTAAAVSRNHPASAAATASNHSAAMASISTSAPLGMSLPPNATRAGFTEPMNTSA